MEGTHRTLSKIMSASALQIFDSYAREYDAPRHRLVPDFDNFYESVADALSFSFAPNAEFRVCDLGAGTGLLTGVLAARFPRAQFVLCDAAPQMLELARERFANQDRFTFVTHDFEHQTLPGNFDAVVSALAIHHLASENLAPLFGRVRAALNVGGVFVNADQTLGVAPFIADEFEARWRDNARANGSDEAEIATAIERRRVDQHAPLEFQLDALRQAGFADVECIYKRFLFAVMAAWMPRD